MDLFPKSSINGGLMWESGMLSWSHSYQPCLACQALSWAVTKRVKVTIKRVRVKSMDDGAVMLASGGWSVVSWFRM